MSSPSMIGQTLRHYRIETKLGAGGMGIVYRARDMHLDRSVAIKVLPAAAVSDPDRKERLVREARAASALNHPNIITIYDVGSDTAEGTPVDFIAMEFVPGKTLDRMIGRKGLKVTEALKYAIQIADALAAAHATGIVHRDLKPANIMVSDQGYVKVLDFGLAKQSAIPKADAYAATESVHLALETGAGTIVGTVAYMSPEQAEAKPIDARADIFSFGAMLYEMISGQRPFSGDSKLSILATILQKDPPPVTEFAGQTPHELERLIFRCMQKEPAKRWQSMADVKAALEDLLADIETNRLAPAAAAARAKTWKRWMWPAVAAIAIGAGAGTYVAVRKPAPAPAIYQRLTFRRGDVVGAKFAPDGQTIVYAAEWDGAPAKIFTTIPGNRESRLLGLPDGRILSLSSKGEMAIRLGAGTQGTLARVPLAGGVPREVLENVIEADWSPDGEKLAVTRTMGGKTRLEYPIGTVLYETDGRPPVGPRVSPKGDLVAFFEFDNEIGDYSVSVIGVDGKKRFLSRGWRGVGRLGWSPKADEIWFAAIRLGEDPALRGVTLDRHERLLVQVPAWAVIHDISRDGRILMSVINTRTAISWHAPGANAERDMSWLDTSSVYDLSEDARQLLFLEVSYGEGRNTSIYLRSTDGSPAVLLGYGNRPALSPDSKWVVAVRSDPSQPQLVVLPTGAGEPKILTAKGLRYESAEWFPTSHEILFTALKAGHAIQTYEQDLDGNAPKPLGPEGMKGSRVTPDGRSMVVARGPAYMLVSLSGIEQRRIGAAEPGEKLMRWSADGRYLFIRRTRADARAIDFLRLDTATGQKQLWKEVGPSDPVGVAVGNAAITPDGAAYAYSFQRDLSNLFMVTGVR